jgi:hypothetical protein
VRKAAVRWQRMPVGLRESGLGTRMSVRGRRRSQYLTMDENGVFEITSLQRHRVNSRSKRCNLIVHHIVCATYIIQQPHVQARCQKGVPEIRRTPADGAKVSRRRPRAHSSDIALGFSDAIVYGCNAVSWAPIFPTNTVATRKSW